MGRQSRAKRERREQRELERNQQQAIPPERSEVERASSGGTLQENKLRRFLEAKLEEEWERPHRGAETFTLLNVPGFRIWAAASWYDEDDGVEESFVGGPTPGEEDFLGQSWEWTVEVYDAEYDNWEPVGVAVEGRHDQKPEIPQGVIDQLIENDFEIPLERSTPGLEF